MRKGFAIFFTNKIKMEIKHVLNTPIFLLFSKKTTTKHRILAVEPRLCFSNYTYAKRNKGSVGGPFFAILDRSGRMAFIESGLS